MDLGTALRTCSSLSLSVSSAFYTSHQPLEGKGLFMGLIANFRI